MGSELVHFMIPAEDPGRISGFYHDVLDWTIEPLSPEFPDYLAITTSDREGAVAGGMMKKMAPEQGLLNYYLVDDLEEYNAKVRGNGGQVAVEKMPVPGIGYFSVCLDPEGNPFGLWLDDENAG
jgi:predicted enzyme related to lactoylglutathione lyase